MMEKKTEEWRCCGCFEWSLWETHKPIASSHCRDCVKTKYICKFCNDTYYWRRDGLACECKHRS